MVLDLDSGQLGEVGPHEGAREHQEELKLVPYVCLRFQKTGGKSTRVDRSEERREL